MRSSMAYPLLAIAWLMVACGTISTPRPEPSAGAPPKAGGVLSIPIPQDPFDWDPITLAKPGSQGGLGLATNTLVGVQVGPDIAFTDSILKPALAERWDVSADARTFTFHLRPGVKFAGAPPMAGRDLTSADVKFSLEYLGRFGEFKGKGSSQVVDFLQGITAVDTPDPSTAVVQFSEPFVPFLSYAAAEWLPILPREIYSQDGHFKDHIAGTGPYQLDQAASQKGSRWVWRKNTGYWEAGKPYLDEVRWVVLPNDASQLAAFQTKQVDVLGYGDKIRYKRAQELRKASPEALWAEYIPSISFSISDQQPGPPADRRSCPQGPGHRIG